MKPTHYSPLTTHSSRRGVVLIVVLGMLAVLALLGVAFTTFSGQEEQSSGRYQAAFQTPRVDMAPDQLFVEGLSQLIADTNNHWSGIRSHSVLGDMYGQGSDYGVGPDGRPGVAGVDDDGNGVTDDMSELGAPGSDDRNGVLNAHEWYAGAFSGSGDRGLYQPVDPGPDGIVGTSDDCFDVNFVWNRRVPNPLSGIHAGGFNEDYDYPDRQNMFLALLRADGTVLAASFVRPGVGAPLDSDLDASNPSNKLVAGRTAPLPVTAADQRARLKLLRPRGGFIDANANGRHDTGELTTENPAFPPFNPLVLDIDNNGDGIPDSVWLDLGLPVQQSANGRKFKPLFAFLVVDCDGKLNLNAHGNVANVLLSPAGHADFDLVGNVLGQGYSPGEVALQNVFKDVTALPAYALLSGVGANEYYWLLTGRPSGGGPATPIAGRYGETFLIGGPTPPQAGKTNEDTTPPTTSGPTMGDDDAPRTLAVAPYWNYPLRGNYDEGRRYVVGGVKDGRYGTPSDFNGDGALGVDAFGRFIYYASDPRMGWGGTAAQWPTSMVFNGHSQAFDNVDDQAEVDLYVSRSTDAVFQPSDMEYLYRHVDIDSSSLVSRLLWLTPSLVPSPDTPAAARRRMMTTTESWDLNRYNMFPLTQGIGTAPPAPPIETELVPLIRAFGSGRFNTQGLAGRAYPAGTPNDPGLVHNPGPNTPAAEFGLSPGLPLEIARGRRMNLNRGYFGSVASTSAVTSAADPRAVARDIYIVMRQLRPVDPTTTAGRTACEQMAQFAVNAVDFRDPDQVMTGFEFVYDLTTNGWFVDGSLDASSADNSDPNRGLVWGVEAPQIVINETYAIEDPSAVGMPQLWFELFNPQHLDLTDNAFRAGLRGAGTDSAYQVILADTSPGLAGGGGAVGEPSTTSRRLDFTNTPTAPAVGGTFVGNDYVDPDSYYLVGPTTVAGTALTPTPDFEVLENTFSPTAAEIGSTLRLYLRRLADPGAAHDPGTDGLDGTADDVNPYLTVDALDVQVYSETDVNPGMGLPPTHRSIERTASYSVAREFHTNGIATPHTLKAINEKSSTSSGTPYCPLPFNDRPFASPMELLLVPGVRPQWLTSTFVVPNVVASPYAPTANRSLPIRTGESSDVNPSAPFVDSPYYLFGHLMNFFYEVSTGSQSFPDPALYRILEFVEVPSRMNGSTDPTIGPLAGDNRLDRVPGKMNINTAIAEQEQFLAMFNNHPLVMAGVNPSFPMPAGSLMAKQIPNPGNAPVSGDLCYPSRSGTAVPTSEVFKRSLDSVFGPDGILGTADDLPFRSWGVGRTTIAAPQMIQPTDIHNTLLRGWPTSGGFPFPTAGSGRSTADMPLFFDSRATAAPPGGSGATSLLGYPNFQYQSLTKISNNVTTRSNVFAVWITVGFFEVLNEDPNRLNTAPNDFGVDNAPPELGREINADIGKNIRHRAFFIIDRSRARGYAGPPRSSAELQDILSQVVIHSRIIE
jgi:hypothetical protein